MGDFLQKIEGDKPYKKETPMKISSGFLDCLSISIFHVFCCLDLEFRLVSSGELRIHHL